MLWDIDMTLVEYPGTGRSWYRDALANLFGISLEHAPRFLGRTERALTIELLVAHGITNAEDHVPRFFAELVRLAGQTLAELPTLGRALPGAAEVLGELHSQPDVVQSLVTGNLIELAGYKLEPFGLDRYVDFEIGGYGSLSEHRHDLVAAAMAAAAAKYGTELSPTSVVVIGDTPLDVQAALHHGAAAIGVATGRHSVSELRRAGAQTVLPSLSDTRTVLDAVLGAQTQH